MHHRLMYRLLNEKAASHPVLAASISFSLKYLVADLGTQTVVEGNGRGRARKIDYRRALLFGCFGFVYGGVFNYHVFRLIQTLSWRRGSHATPWAIALRSTVLDVCIHLPFLFYPLFYISREVAYNGSVSSSPLSLFPPAAFAPLATPATPSLPTDHSIGPLSCRRSPYLSAPRTPIQIREGDFPLELPVGPSSSSSLTTPPSSGDHDDLLGVELRYSLSHCAGRGLEHYKNNFWEDVRVALMVFVPIDLVMFRFLPLHLRTPFLASIGLIFPALLSSMRGRPAPSPS